MLATWTLEDLTNRMRAALAKTGVAEEASKANGQVAEVPNARTVRYYTTIGVLDRPQQSGRTALYGRRHLEQLVAIKRMQADGKTLAEIQRALPALDDKQLAALAALPHDVEHATHGPVEKPAEERRERSFWAAAPAPAPTHVDGTAHRHAHGDGDGQKSDAGDEAVTEEIVTEVAGVQLESGVTLTFRAARAVDDDDRKALRAALLEVEQLLRARGLT